MNAFASPIPLQCPCPPFSQAPTTALPARTACPWKFATRRRCDIRLRRHRVVSVAQSGAGSSAEGSGPAADEPAILADRIARAFVDACTPSATPYAAQIARFCGEALEAYRAGYSLVALQLELSNATTSIGRSLASDEVELRSVWLSLVYKTLRQIRFPSAGPPELSAPASGFDRDRLDDFVGNIVAAVRRGYDMKRIQLEQALTGSNGKDSQRTPLESAILNQSTRLVITTLELADELLGSSS